MKHILTLISFIFSLLLMLPFAAWLLLKSANIENLIHDLEKDLIKSTKLPLKFDGNIHFHLWPLPYLHIPHISLEQKISDNIMHLNVDDLVFKIRLYPLLQKKIIFHKVKSKNLNIYTEPGQDNNINFKIQNTSPIANQTLQILNADHFDIEEFIIQNGKISNLNSEYPSEFTSLELVAKQVKLNQPFNIKITGLINYQLPNSPASNTKCSYQGTIAFEKAAIHDLTSFINNAKFEGLLQLDGITYKNIKINTVKTNIISQNQAILLNPLTIKFIDGTSTGDANFNFETKQLFFNQSSNDLNLNSETFINTHNAQWPTVSGHLNYSLHGHINFKDNDTINQMTGNGHIAILDGNIHHFDFKTILNLTKIKINHLLNQSNQASSEQPILQNPEIYWGDTRFSEFFMDFSFEQANIRSHQFKFQNDYLKIQGQGAYNINTQFLNSRINIAFDTGDQQLNKIEAMLPNGFPVHIHGDINQLHVKPDLKIIMPYIQSLVINRSLNKPFDELQAELSNFFNPNNN